MKCSKCNKEGHKSNNRKFHPTKEDLLKKIQDMIKKKKEARDNTLSKLRSNSKQTPLTQESKKDAILQTEDTGKVFEMAICLAYGIPYDGKFKYDMKRAENLKDRLIQLPTLFPNATHTAKKGARYDFTSSTNSKLHLSAKTTKKGVGKIAPQVLGQSQPKKFCDTIGIEYKDIPSLKEYIQTNISSILPTLTDYTFDCDTVYYNEETDSIKYIQLKSQPEWSSYTYKWTCDHSKWNNSSTVKIVKDDKEIPLVEFQFHTKSRTNMAVRWCFENVLTLFNKQFLIRLL
jgi:hypothetical protein